MEDVYEELESCSVCFNPFDASTKEPIILPCMHTICKLCLDNLRWHDTKSHRGTSTRTVPPETKLAPCPFCRKIFSRNSVQPNRYILVHLRHVQRQRQRAATAASFEASAPPQSLVYDEVPEQGDTEDKWCTHCETPASNECTDHITIPMSQFVKSVKDSVDEKLEDLKLRVCTVSSSIEEMEKVFNEVFAVLNQAKMEFKMMEKNTQDLKSQVDDLKSSCVGVDIPPNGNLLPFYADLLNKMLFSCGWLTRYVDRMEGKMAVQSLHKGTFQIIPDGTKTITVSSKSDSNSFDVSIVLTENN